VDNFPLSIAEGSDKEELAQFGALAPRSNTVSSEPWLFSVICSSHLPCPESPLCNDFKLKPDKALTRDNLAK
jgi:hypothetical protein